MAIDFPDSPSLNQTYTVGVKRWKYDGEKWVVIENSTSIRDNLIRFYMEVL
jgi:hypothetical protein